MASTVESSQHLQRNQLGLLGVITPGVAQVAPALLEGDESLAGDPIPVADLGT
jgi:hypothetical protein